MDGLLMKAGSLQIFQRHPSRACFRSAIKKAVVIIFFGTASVCPLLASGICLLLTCMLLSGYAG